MGRMVNHGMGWTANQGGFRRGRFVRVAAVMAFGVAAAILALCAGPKTQGHAMAKFPFDSERERIRGIMTSSLDANSRYFAFSIILSDENPNEQVGIAIYALETGEWTVLKPTEPEDGFASPRFSSADPDILYIHVSDLRFPKFTTMKRCEVKTLTCIDVMTMKGRLTDPIEVPEGLLFVYSPPHKDFREFGFADHDFYLRTDDGKVERLSHMEYFQLASVNVLPDRIIAQAIGPSKAAQRRIGAATPEFVVGEPHSDIRELNYQGTVRRLQFDASSLEPIGLLKGLSVMPSAMAGSPLLAFSNNPFEGGGYNLAAQNMETGEQRYVRAETEDMSQPIVIDDDMILYYEQQGGNYRILRFSFSSGEIMDVANISEAEIQTKKMVLIEGGGHEQR